jgi:hypothetical protein
MTVAERLAQIHAGIQIKLAQQGLPTDRETLAEVCTAMACLVRDPDSLQLHSSPMSAEDYAVVADCLALADWDFAEEITALRTLVTLLERDLPPEIDAWVASGRLSLAQASEIIRDTVLARFLDLHDDEPEREESQRERTWGDQRAGC